MYLTDSNLILSFTNLWFTHWPSEVISTYIHERNHHNFLRKHVRRYTLSVRFWLFAGTIWLFVLLKKIRIIIYFICDLLYYPKYFKHNFSFFYICINFLIRRVVIFYIFFIFRFSLILWDGGSTIYSHEADCIIQISLITTHCVHTFLNMCDCSFY